MMDLIQRLRNIGVAFEIGNEAADEIERLRQELSRANSHTESWKELADGRDLIVDWSGDSLRLLLGDVCHIPSIRWDALVKLKEENERLRQEVEEYNQLLGKATIERDEARNVGRRFWLWRASEVDGIQAATENPWLEEESNG